MTDFQTPPAAPAPAVEPAAPVVDAGAPVDDVVQDWRAKYEEEKEHRQRERNLYKPIAQKFGQMPPEQRDAIMYLAEQVVSGNNDAILDWSLTTAANVSGKPLPDLIAERVLQQGQQAQAPTQQPQFSPEEIVRQAREAALQDFRLEQQKQALTGILTAAGYDPHSHHAASIIHIAKSIAGESPEAALRQAINQYREDISANAAQILQAQQQQQAAAAVAAGQVPAAAPSGAAASAVPMENMTPRERMAARLRGQAGAS